MNRKLINNKVPENQPPSTWLGKLWSRIKRFFSIPLNYVWVGAGSNEPKGIKPTNTDVDKPKSRLSTMLLNPLHTITNQEKQSNGPKQSPNTSFQFRQKPINGQKPRHRGRIK